VKIDVFNDIEHFYDPKRQHFTMGYLSPTVFEPIRAGFALAVDETDFTLSLVASSLL
jgi:hypothetical protein